MGDWGGAVKVLRRKGQGLCRWTKLGPSCGARLRVTAPDPVLWSSCATSAAGPTNSPPGLQKTPAADATPGMAAKIDVRAIRRAIARPVRRPCSRCASVLDAQLAEEVAFAEGDAFHAQDVVGGGGVEIEVW